MNEVNQATSHHWKPAGIGLIVVGDEILSGKRQDKHMPKVIELLQTRGMSLDWSRCIGDDPARLVAALADAFASADLVFCCGGIGATPDDHTRQSAAAALGVDLVLHPEAKALIEQRMRDMAAEKGEVYDPNRPDNVHRFNMGVFPAGAAIIANPYNRIPGFTAQSPSGATIHFVPGFPVMAWPMIESVLDNQYGYLHTTGQWSERSVIVLGAIEAQLTPLMQRMEQGFGVRVFSLPSVDHPEFGRHIELGVKGSPALVDQAFAAMRDALKEDGVPLGPELVRGEAAPK
ncbi:molybdopterin-binding protein [Hydrogenophaga sp. 5NK40-0174]|uniref:competence/damage-inducible protein A n=1 Tax=Hydrogenophaga sp. 5NK40-0174 TaxID=3127649 RepID=UPI003107A353